MFVLPTHAIDESKRPPNVTRNCCGADAEPWRSRNGVKQISLVLSGVEHVDDSA